MTASVLENDGNKLSMARNKVPEPTATFWIIKVLATTVGETFADFLATNLNLGLTNTTYVMGALLVIALVFQFRSNRYTPGIYWLAVVLISVVGTLITDNLTDNFGVPLEATTVIFAIALLVTFVAWFASERTLSIHSIKTTRREAFYWLAILFTFALGTAAGDLISEGLNLGYGTSVVIFAVAIAVITGLRFGARLNAVFAFWFAYILTRPLGASLGDLLAQPAGDGGLALGTVTTSIVFLGAILGLIVFLTIDQRRKVITASKEDIAYELESELALER
ncbi:COG4705 family protein [Glaciibacter sp. 2TAF33]|uniref:COG4705 family protein n=1 Tax=Glaciibacter sp. 2TAF33 TaxID=3233015 RepID=UPI003F9007C3